MDILENRVLHIPLILTPNFRMELKKSKMNQ